MEVPGVPRVAKVTIIGNSHPISGTAADSVTMIIIDIDCNQALQIISGYCVLYPVNQAKKNNYSILYYDASLVAYQ